MDLTAHRSLGGMEGCLLIIDGFLSDDGCSYICVIYATEQYIHVLQRNTLSFWNIVPDEDEENHIDSTKHIHRVAAETVSISTFQAELK